MSKPRRRPRAQRIRPQWEARKAGWKERKKTGDQLRQRKEEQGLVPFAQPTLSNRKCTWQTEEEERAERQAAVEGQVKVLRSQLPKLLCRLAKIKDPRNPETSKHKLTVLLLYGLLSFVYQLASRREANREMTRPVFTENLRLLFPELETMPHQDTLNRLLSRIDVGHIEQAHVELVKDFLRNKKFQRYLVGKHYIVAIDGTQKFSRDYRWAEECQERRVGGAGGEGSGELAEFEYYVYVLEAALIFPNGMTLPLLSEFLRYPDGDVETAKQDCELKAFKRLTARLKESFPRLPLLLVLDGLYPNGPVLALCRQHHWQYVIVLQDKSLRSVWEEAEGLRKLSSSEDTLEQKWGDRRQHFWWANDIEYDYESEGKRKTEKVHVVVCEETWEAVDPKTNKLVEKHSRHAWLSSKPLNRQNVHERCNLMARHRWRLENNLLVEKHQGYHYEHCFSYNWNALRGYHYLMHLAHLLNALTLHSFDLTDKVLTLGIRGLLHLLRQTVSGPWLDPERIRTLVATRTQLRLA